MGDFVRRALRWLSVPLGHARESQQALDDVIAEHAQAHAHDIADVYAWRGEKDQAFAWLERVHQQSLSLINVDPLLASLHGDPRYKALLRKMNFPE